MSELGESPLAAGQRQLSVDEARARITAALRPIAGTQTVALAAALGRVLAADVISPLDVPPHDNSAMDGYAFDGQALERGQALALRCIGTLPAGAPFAGRVGAGECLRIMTGAVMPPGLDTVVPLELVRTEPQPAGGELVHVAPDVIRAGENRRRRGEDLAAGQPALRTGRVLRPADLGLAASLGLEQLTVRRRLRVALFSTGDEIAAPGEALRPGCVYDSNRASLRGALERLGFEVLDLGLVRDDRAALAATLEHAVAGADVVLTSGGVSMGDADYTREVLAQMGEVAFWKVAMRPGRPFAFGPLRAAAGGATSWLFALPGNPVAALVSFYAFAREALLQLAGADRVPLPVLQARCASAIRKRPGRTEFQRGIVAPDADGHWQVRPSGAQGAGILRSMSEANCLIVLRHEQGSVASGEPVDVWLFDGLV